MRSLYIKEGNVSRFHVRLFLPDHTATCSSVLFSLSIMPLRKKNAVNQSTKFLVVESLLKKMVIKDLPARLKNVWQNQHGSCRLPQGMMEICGVETDNGVERDRVGG